MLREHTGEGLMNRRVVGVLCALLLAGWALARCGSSPSVSDGGLDSPAGDEPSIDSNTFGDAGPQCTSCSNDLHDVLDCDGGVVQHCPDDQGCAPKIGCAPACEAAAADRGSAGCDFFTATVAPEYETRGSCHAVLITNVWTAPVSFTASYGSQTLKPFVIARVPSGSGATLHYDPFPVTGLPPGGIAVLFLSERPSGDPMYVPCPLGTSPGIGLVDTSVDGTGVGTTFRITSSMPISAYDVYPYGGAASKISSATLLLQTSAWGTNYEVVGAYPADLRLQLANGYPFVQLYAQQDGTKISIRSPVDILGGGSVSGAKANSTITYSLKRGEFLQLMQPEELSGAFVTSNYPVAVVSGTSCMDIPISEEACDSAHQQLWPVAGLGNEYVAVRYGNRPLWPEEVVPWRIAAAVDGTVVTYDPTQAGAPNSLGGGEVAQFTATGPFVVKSQDAAHPIMVAAYMTGAGSDQSPLNDAGTAYLSPNGDPEFVNVITPPQYLKSYSFLTDPTYANTNLVFVRGLGDDSKYHDVTLDCVGVLGGWTAVGSSAYQYTRVDLVSLGIPQGACDNGVHRASSDAPFGLTVWGYDDAVSYAYPAGALVRPINSVVVGPPTPN
jgi:hypothetical protein